MPGRGISEINVAESWINVGWLNPIAARTSPLLSVALRVTNTSLKNLARTSHFQLTTIIGAPATG